MISSMFSTISIVIMNICIVIIIISSSIATVRAYAESGGSEWGNDIYIYILLYDYQHITIHTNIYSYIVIHNIITYTNI